jgi:hypothetical protein
MAGQHYGFPKWLADRVERLDGILFPTGKQQQQQ